MDCEQLTWSLGCRNSYSPLWWPRSSSARLAMTSLAFMFVEVPAPPWIMSTVKWSCSLPGDDFVAGRHDRIGRSRHRARRVRRSPGGGLLHVGQRADEMDEVYGMPEIGKVFHAAQASARRSRRVGQLAFAEGIVLLAPGGDDRRRRRSELLGGREPPTQPPGDVADHPIEDFRFFRARLVQNRPRNQPDTRDWPSGRRRGGVRQVVQHHALAEVRVPGGSVASRTELP